MKWIYRRLLLGVLFCVFTLPVLANHSYIRIVNLNTAKAYKGSAREIVYIRTKSFSKLSKARRYQHKLIARTKYPVSISRHRHHYTVIVGPIKSAANVRNTAAMISILPKSKTAVHRHHHVKHKHKYAYARNTPKKSARLAASTAKVVSPKPAAHPAPVVQNETVDDIDPAPYEPDVEQYKHLFEKKPLQNNWFVTVGGGIQYPLFNNARTRINNGSGFPPPANLDIYSFKNENHPVFDLAGGYRFERDDKWFPAYSVGLAYQYLFTNDIGGTIMQFSLPSFTNYTYSWNISAHVLLVEGKVNVFEYKHFMPYINAGLGGVSIRSSGYSEQPLPGVTPRVSAGYEDKTMIKIAYALGLGVDYQISPRWIATAGYQYLNLGDVSTGVGAGTWAGKSLYLGSYSANEGLVSVTYLFENMS